MGTLRCASVPKHTLTLVSHTMIEMRIVTIGRTLVAVSMVSVASVAQARPGPSSHYVEIYVPHNPPATEIRAIRTHLGRDGSVAGYWYVTCERQIRAFDAAHNLKSSPSTCETRSRGGLFPPFFCVAAKPNPTVLRAAWSLWQRYTRLRLAGTNDVSLFTPTQGHKYFPCVYQ